MKNIDILLITCIILLTASAIYGTITTHITQQEIIDKYDDEVSDFEFLEEAMKRFKEHRNYTEEYDCVNFSNDFQHYIGGFGFDAPVIVSGTEFDEQGFRYYHAYNAIVIEPQHGSIVDYREKYPVNRRVE